MAQEKGAREIDIMWSPQYETGANPRMRREYMELAERDLPEDERLYQKVYRSAGVPLGATTLDVGYGDGVDLIDIALNDPSGVFMGIEVPYEMVGVFSHEDRHYAAEFMANERGVSNAKFMTGLAQDTGLPDNSVDHIRYNAVAQHFEDLSEAVAEMVRILKPGGTASFITNGELNKPLHHKILRNIYKQLRIEGMGPLSQKFTVEIALRELQKQQSIKIVQIVPQYGLPIPITGETLPYLEKSLFTYKGLTPRKVSGEEWQKAQDNALKPVLKKIEKKGMAYDLLYRGGIIVENTKPVVEPEVGIPIGSIALMS